MRTLLQLPAVRASSVASIRFGHVSRVWSAHQGGVLGEKVCLVGPAQSFDCPWTSDPLSTGPYNRALRCSCE